MNVSEFPEESRLNEGAARLISYLLVVGMISCSALTLATLVQHIIPSWQPGVTAALAGFIACERLYTYQRSERLAAFTSEWLIDLASQWVVIALAVRLVLGLSHGWQAFRAEFLLLSLRPFDYILSPEFLAMLAIALMVWLLTGQFAGLLDEMGIRQTRMAMEAPILAGYVPPPPRARLMSLVFTLGIYLTIFTAMVRLNTRTVFLAADEPLFLKLGVFSGGGASTLLYFMLGLTLLSETQFIALNTRWRLGGNHISRRLARRWGLYSILFLLMIAALAAVLPTGYSLRFLASLGSVLDVVAAALFSIAQVLLAVIIFLLEIPFLLLGANSPFAKGGPAVLPTPAPPGQAPPPPAVFPWWPLVAAILSWALLLGVVGYSLYEFLRRNEGFVERLPGGRWLLRAWYWLRATFGGVGRGVTRIVEAGIRRLRGRSMPGQAPASGGFLNLGRLDPRQRVHYFYLALIRRGGERGLNRNPSQTPYEYASTLESALPSVDEDIQSMTGSFVEARYSLRTIGPEEATTVRAMWDRIRRALRVIKKP